VVRRGPWHAHCSGLGMQRLPEPFRSGLTILGSVTVVAWLQGCSYFRDQVAITTASQCVNRECGDEVGAARPQCEGECYRRYGR
jgi:hypothetical protein